MQPDPKQQQAAEGVGTVGVRTRLFVAFGAMVLLTALVGLTSLLVHQRMRSQVAHLGSQGGVDLGAIDLTRVGLELEGFWDPMGTFVASDVRVVRRLERPKLRGTVQSSNPRRGTVKLYGTAIRIDHTTRFLTEGDTFEHLRPGTRAEITCEVGERGWVASKVRTRDVKESDKIKGTVTSSDLDGTAPETVSIHGLVVSLAPSAHAGPEGAMRHVDATTRMLLALGACRRASEQALRNPDERHLDEIRAALDAFEDALADVSDSDAVGDDPAAGAHARLIHPLREEAPALRAEAERFIELASLSAPQARQQLDEVLDPLIESTVLPYLYAYRSTASDEVDDQLRAIVSQTSTTTRVALVTSAIATMAAILLGLFVWRSIHRPIVALHEAARRIGRGDLDTRVAWSSADELGELAEAFDRMASELARTTVSVAEKELLLREVHHRVKNNMQIISSLLGLQSIRANDKQTLGTLEESQSRIRSMALIHEQLYRSSELDRIDIGGYLERLTSHLSRALRGGEDVEIALDIEDVEIDIDQSLACGLIVNELVTNAFKHAFPAARPGRISVSLRREGADIVLQVADDGSGVATLGSERDSLGTQLVQTLTHQLNGHLETSQVDGTAVRITFPARTGDLVST